MKSPSELTQLELTLPMIETIKQLGGRAKAKDVIEALNEKLRIPEEIRNESFVYQPKGVNRVRYPWRQKLHWVSLHLVHRDLLTRESRGIWELTDKAEGGLAMAAPGTILVVYETANGRAVWAEAETAVGFLQKKSFHLLFTSPPYPLNNPRAYGNRSEGDHIQWVVNLAKDMKQLLVEDGSMFLNMGSVWQPGQPTQSAYEERILLALIDDAKFHLCQKLYWENPVKIPATPWVTIKRVRLNPTVEPIFWLGNSANVKANNRNCLTPYKPDMLRRLERGKNYRKSPSGHLTCANPFAVNNGGAIARTLIEASNTISNDAYIKGCRAEGLPVHPARFPEALPELAIKLTTDVGDNCADICAGSNVFGAVCERLGRNWTAIDKSLAYTLGGRHRFQNPVLAPEL